MEFHPPAVCAALRERDERLESLKAFASRMAHDCRNALVPQLGYIALIQEEAGAQSPILACTAALEKNLQKTTQNIEAVLEEVRPERRFSPAKVDFTALVEQGIAEWKGSLAKDPTIRLESEQWVREWPEPPPPRCRDGVDSPYLPACGCPTPGDPITLAPFGETSCVLWFTVFTLLWPAKALQA